VLAPSTTKLNFDDNALEPPQGRRRAPRTFNEEDPLDVEASKYGLNYIKLGRQTWAAWSTAPGLAMATMDIVKLAAGEPANSSTWVAAPSPEQIENAFRILSSDPSVKAVFINVFRRDPALRPVGPPA
jgi:succinyl-CoA synthetase beta subunit